MSNQATSLAESACNRREFLLAGALASVGLGLPTTSRAAAKSPASPAPRNLIFCVSDGMSASVPGLADAFSLQTRRRPTAWRLLMENADVHSGLMDTASLNSMVTDSAAAASAWGGGRRVNNGSINMLPDGGSVTPVGHLAKARGLGLGLVTTATVTHATPAGFAANVPKRAEEEAIAAQYLGIVDVALGGGRPFFDAAVRADGSDLLGGFRDAQYAILTRRAQLAELAGKRKILGLFSDGYLPYCIDRPANPEVEAQTPSLREMTAAALGALGEFPEGFLLQVEGARVDHAAHQNDIATLLHEQLDFDDALGLALEFAAARGDTLVIATSDHGNSNPGLNGMGPSYTESTKAFEKVAGATGSFAALHAWARHRLAQPDALHPWELAAEAARTLGFFPSPSEAGQLLANFANAPSDAPTGDWNAQHGNFWGLLGQAAGNHFGTGWTGITHTADYTILNAIGPGSELFGGFLRNDEIFGRITGLLRLA